ARAGNDTALYDYVVTPLPEVYAQRFHLISLPTTGAIVRRSRTTSSNCSGLMDWLPSQSACSGSLCTSMISPSAPTAIAARARAGTIHALPVACEGSTMMGRCETFLTATIAERSRVLRV